MPEKRDRTHNMPTTNSDDSAGTPQEGQKMVQVLEFRDHRTEDALEVEHMHFTSLAQEALCSWAYWTPYPV